ncbi:hypothetical protein LshimejAT787_0502830 [Lyophyllum shimeji]|uniref:Uncharacterized protein n=1 Tax=Lyophyllum shimeji TaxID=47721 RepID=A0A9P3PMZ6_LYOSH|nr:hypothetical protein LshimejAT787_0502830 [Lyophyllum shimeji]
MVRCAPRAYSQSYEAGERDSSAIVLIFSRYSIFAVPLPSGDVVLPTTKSWSSDGTQEGSRDPPDTLRAAAMSSGTGSAPDRWKLTTSFKELEICHDEIAILHEAKVKSSGTRGTDDGLNQHCMPCREVHPREGSMTRYLAQLPPVTDSG